VAGCGDDDTDGDLGVDPDPEARAAGTNVEFSGTCKL
jgi:hypothetical protein